MYAHTLPAYIPPRLPVVSAPAAPMPQAGADQPASFTQALDDADERRAADRQTQRGDEAKRADSAQRENGADEAKGAARVNQARGPKQPIKVPPPPAAADARTAKTGTAAATPKDGEPIDGPAPDSATAGAEGADAHDEAPDEATLLLALAALPRPAPLPIVLPAGGDGTATLPASSSNTRSGRLNAPDDITLAGGTTPGGVGDFAALKEKAAAEAAGALTVKETAAPALQPNGPELPPLLPTALTAATATTVAASAPAEARIAASPGSADFATQLGAQLTTFVKDGIQHAKLELHPVELGPVTVQIQLDGNNAQVNMAAEHATTRHSLEQALPHLAGSLREAGLTLSGGGVFEQQRQPQNETSGGSARALRQRA